MRSIFLVIQFFLYLVNIANAQDTSKIELRLNLLNVGYGIGSTAITGDVNNAERFILCQNSKGVLGIGIIELESSYKYIGARLGLEFYQTNLNSSVIRDQFEDQFDGYSVSIPEVDYDNNVVPITGGFKPLAIDIGLIGYLKYKKFAFVPSLCYIHSLTKDNYSVEAEFYHISSGMSSSRRYSYKESNHVGFRLGIDFRYEGSVFYSGVRILYVNMISKGNGTIKEIYGNGSISEDYSTYMRGTNLYNIGINIGIKLR